MSKKGVIQGVKIKFIVSKKGVVQPVNPVLCKVSIRRLFIVLKGAHNRAIFFRRAADALKR